MPDDYTANKNTTGTVAVGGSATGSIESRYDRDWFVVTLEASKTYRFDLAGSQSERGTLSNPYLHGIHDAGGTAVAGTSDDDGGAGRDARVTFTAPEDATWYVVAGAAGNQLGGYTLSVEEVL